MRSKINYALSLFLVIVFCSMTIHAQEKDPNKISHFASKGKVKPSMLSKYISISKEIAAECERQNFPYTFYAWTNDEFEYYFFYPVKSRSDIGKILKAWEDFYKVFGKEKEQELLNTLESYEETEFRYLPELSYVPENPRLKDGEGEFILWDIAYFHPGKEKEIEEIEKEFQALFRENKITEGIDCYAGGIGTDAPVYYYVLYGKDASDFYNYNDYMWDLIGKDGRELLKKWMSLLRKREHEQLWYRPELTYKRGVEKTPKPKIVIPELNYVEKLGRSVANTTAISVMAISYAKSVGKTAEDIGKHAGEIYLPYWTGLKGLKPEAIIRVFSRMNQPDENFRMEVISVSDNSVKARMIPAGINLVKAWDDVGVTVDDYIRFLKKQSECFLDALGFKYKQDYDGEWLNFTISVK